MKKPSIKLLIFMIFIILILFTGISAGISFQTPSKESIMEHIAREPIHEMKLLPMHKEVNVRYHFPDRPFDSLVTFTGVGWLDDRFVVEMEVRIANNHIYTDAPKLLTPKAVMGNQTILLSDVIWEEGSRLSYQNSVYRYVLSSSELKTMPSSLQFYGKEILLDSNMSPSKTINWGRLELTKQGGSPLVSFHDMKIQVSTIDTLNKRLEVMIDAPRSIQKPPTMILIDDQNRMYSFSDQISEIKQGRHSYDLTLLQDLPGDVHKLELVAFTKQYEQQHLYYVQDEARLLIYNDSTPFFLEEQVVKPNLWETVKALIMPDGNGPASKGESVGESEQLKEGVWYPVLSIIYPNTFTIKTEQGKQTVELIGVRPPRYQVPYKSDEPFGKEAYERVKQLLLQQDVRLVFDQVKTAKQGTYYYQYQAYVYLRDGRLLNEVLIEEGLARVDQSPPNVMHLDLLKAAEERAGKNKIGIWHSNQ